MWGGIEYVILAQPEHERANWLTAVRCSVAVIGILTATAGRFDRHLSGKRKYCRSCRPPSGLVRICS